MDRHVASALISSEREGRREGTSIKVQVRDHEYAPWNDLEVLAQYDRDDLGFVYLRPTDGTELRPVRRSNVRRRNPAWRPRSLHGRWLRLSD